VVLDQLSQQIEIAVMFYFESMGTSAIANVSNQSNNQAKQRCIGQDMARKLWEAKCRIFNQKPVQPGFPQTAIKAPIKA